MEEPVDSIKINYVKHKSKHILLVILLMVSLPLLAQNQVPQSDTLSIYFHLDKTDIDMTLSDNDRRWQSFVENFNQTFAGVDRANIRLDIYAGASPEGSIRHNEWLGEERGQSIRRLLQQQLGDRIGFISVHNEAARWQGLYNLVASSDEYWREEVMDIINGPKTIDDRGFDSREKKLRQIHDGWVWTKLLRDYLPQLRSGGSAVVSWQPAVVRPCVTCEGVRDTIVIKDTLVIVKENTVYYHPEKKKVKKEPQLADQTPAWAVKTNLLLWGVVAPNVEVEIPLGNKNRWSLEAEFFHPWFIWSKNAHASQFLNLGVELRYWLGKRQYHRWLDGWHVGVAVAAGLYDWEWKKHEGYHGEYINTYINLGYQHRWGKHWAIDAGIGVGVIPSKYRHYLGSSTYPDRHLEEQDYHLMYHDSDHFVFPGPTHINVSIVYLFNARPFHFK